MICLGIGFLGGVMGILFVNWIAPWFYEEQIRQLQARITELEKLP